MNLSITVPANPLDLARTIAALANSGGGHCIIEGEPGEGREALLTAIPDIVPPPIFPGRQRGNQAKEKRRVPKHGIVRPANITVREDETGLIVTVTPGESLCTISGKVVVFEEGVIRALTITEVVRMSGSGG